MEITGFNAVNGQSDNSNTLAKQQITRDDFLKLLISQLQNQDPLDPMDNQQFASQLATFNSLEQLIGVNEKLKDLQGKMFQSSQFGATALIGKEVSLDGNQISVKSGESTLVRYHLSGNATRVVVNVHNHLGELVRTLELGNQSAGDQTIQWDGANNNGSAVAGGVYNFEINAFDSEGKKVPAWGKIQGMVTGVSLEGSEPILELGEMRVPLSAVSAVR